VVLSPLLGRSYDDQSHAGALCSFFDLYVRWSERARGAIVHNLVVILCGDWFGV
jgi:hypothetical protein